MSPYHRNTNLDKYFDSHAEFNSEANPGHKYRILLGSRHLFDDDVLELKRKFIEAVKAARKPPKKKHKIP